MDSLVELLDRQVDFLLRQIDPAVFLIQVEPFLRALRDEPRLAAYLDDLVEEVVQVIDDIEEVDRELTSELLVLRRELVELRPEADDSNVEPPSESGAREVKLGAFLSYRGTLAYFDEWARSEPEPFNADGEGGLAKTLLRILQSKDSAYLREVEAASGRENAEAEGRYRFGVRPALSVLDRSGRRRHARATQEWAEARHGRFGERSGEISRCAILGTSLVGNLGVLWFYFCRPNFWQSAMICSGVGFLGSDAAACCTLGTRQMGTSGVLLLLPLLLGPRCFGPT